MTPTQQRQAQQAQQQRAGLGSKEAARMERNLKNLRKWQQMASTPANNISARRSLAKGKVSWNQSGNISWHANLSHYKLNQIHTSSLVTRTMSKEEWLQHLTLEFTSALLQNLHLAHLRDDPNAGQHYFAPLHKGRVLR